MNDTGMYAAGVRVTPDGGRAAWWTHTGSDLSGGWDLHVPEIPALHAEFLDVNSSGVMTGFTMDTGQGFVFDSMSDAFTWLPDFASGHQDYPRRINASGVISGEASDAVGNSFAASWWPPYTQAERVHAPGENQNYVVSPGTHVKVGSTTYGINDQGTVAGYTFLGGPVHDVSQFATAKQWRNAYAPLFQAFAKSADGGVTRLPAGYDQALGFAVNNAGLVVGGSLRGPDAWLLPAYWRDGLEHDMGAPSDAGFGLAYTVSQGSWAAGGVVLADSQRSFVWTGAGNLQLNEPVSGYDGSWSHGVSDVLHQVAGSSSLSSDDTSVPTVWQCPADFTIG